MKEEDKLTNKDLFKFLGRWMFGNDSTPPPPTKEEEANGNQKESEEVSKEEDPEVIETTGEEVPQGGKVSRGVHERSSPPKDSR
jgi:hypothetical protein